MKIINAKKENFNARLFNQNCERLLKAFISYTKRDTKLKNMHKIVNWDLYIFESNRLHLAIMYHIHTAKILNINWFFVRHVSH